MKPIAQQFIELLHAEEQCPRLTVDATHSGVIVPDFVKAEWKEALPIDLDPSFPLELQMDRTGLRCCLSFRGPYECFFPWNSIYTIQDRESGLGIVIDANLPKTTPRRAKGESTAPRPRAQADLRQPAVEEALEVTEAEERRARFQVIDGGKE